MIIVQCSLSDATMYQDQSASICRRKSGWKLTFPDKWMWAKFKVCNESYHFHADGACWFCNMASKGRNKKERRAAFINTACISVHLFGIAMRWVNSTWKRIPLIQHRQSRPINISCYLTRVFAANINFSLTISTFSFLYDIISKVIVMQIDITYFICKNVNLKHL